MTGDNTLNLSLGELCTFVRGVTYEVHEASPAPSDSCLPILRAGNIADSLDLEHDLVWVPSTRVSNEQRLRGGDIVMCMSSGSAKVVGKSALVMTDWAGSAGAFCGILRPRNSVQARWLAYWLRSVRFVQWRDSQARGANIQNLRFSQLSAVKLQVPSLKEQQRIVAKLDEQMAALDRTEKALAGQQAAALAFKRATLQTAFDQAIHPEWECATLMDLCTFANGLWTGKKPPFQQASVIRNTNFTRDCTLDFSDIAHLDVEERQLRSRRLRTGDIILERSGGGPKQPVGRVALFELNDEFYSFSNFTSVIRVNERNGVLPRFLWYYLFHLYSSGVTEALQNHTSGIRNLDFSSYVMLSIPVPTLDEQRRVVEQLDWSIEQANNLLSYVAEHALTLASLRTSLLDAAFSGEISHD